MDLTTASALLVLLLIFIVALLESVAVIGVIVPGAVLLFSLTVIAQQSNIAWFWVVMFGACGALLGDIASYKAGAKLEKRITRWPWFRHHQIVIEQGHWFFQKWGWISVIIGRLLGPLRPIIPFVAGTMGMPSKTFLPLALIATTLWAPIYLLPGYFTGELHQLWQLQPLNDRSLIIYALSAISIIVAFITIYHHTHPEALHLKGWLSKKQAEFWPIQAISILLLSSFALLATTMLLPEQADQALAIGPQAWQHYRLYPVWKLFDAGQQTYTAAVSFACILLWLLAQSKLKIMLSIAVAMLITVSGASLTHHLLAISDSLTLFTASGALTLLIGFMAIAHANQLKPQVRWLVYFLASCLVLVLSISHLWIGSLALSSLLISIWLGLIGAAISKILWHFMSGPAKFCSPWPISALLLGNVVAYAFISLPIQ